MADPKIMNQTPALKNFTSLPFNSPYWGELNKTDLAKFQEKLDQLYRQRQRILYGLQKKTLSLRLKKALHQNRTQDARQKP